jgi:S-DNA-T family DNA segregation ATPase FtsK/SpoIIIE
MVLLSSAMATVPPLPGWPIAAGSGGAIGSLLLAWLVAVTAGVPLAGRAPIAMLAFLAGAGAMGWGMGGSIADWQLFGRTVRAGAIRLRVAASQVAKTVARGASIVQPRPALIDDVPAAASTADRIPDVRKSALVESESTRVRARRKAEEAAQRALDFEAQPKYRLPPLDLLQVPPPQSFGDVISRNALEQNARMLKIVLDDFGVRGEIVKVRPGPVITLYELEPAPGTKSARVIALADDIARSMSAISARVAVVPGRNVIGIELPNQRREAVCLRELLASDAMERSAGGLTLALGKDIGGTPVIVDLARMPHLLIAGTTGSGKSVGINAMILSLLYRLPPNVCKFILIDPKMLELSVYDGIPHLLAPVVTEPSKAVVALKWTVREMEERYRAMSQLGVRNIAGFNARVAEAKNKGEALTRRVQTGFDEDGNPRFEDQELDLVSLPLIVVVVDEMADLMLVAGKDIEAAVQRLSQMARAAGIHLIMATQRPSVDVITGTIKANFPTRISFQVTSKIDSRTILGEQGAEQLLGQGDMLFMAPGGRVTRVHGPFVSDGEVEAVVQSLKAQGEPQYIDAVTETEEDEAFTAPLGDDEDSDELYREAVGIVLNEGKASTSFVQRRLQIGYNRAARLVERMESEGLVSKADRVGRREILAGERAV